MKESSQHRSTFTPLKNTQLIEYDQIAENPHPENPHHENPHPENPHPKNPHPLFKYRYFY